MLQTGKCEQAIDKEDVECKLTTFTRSLDKSISEMGSAAS
jgi:hypothetical protein